MVGKSSKYEAKNPWAHYERSLQINLVATHETWEKGRENIVAQKVEGTVLMLFSIHNITTQYVLYRVMLSIPLVFLTEVHHTDNPSADIIGSLVCVFTRSYQIAYSR